jgi:hypothetical protein
LTPKKRCERAESRNDCDQVGNERTGHLPPDSSFMASFFCPEMGTNIHKKAIPTALRTDFPNNEEIK